MNSHTADSSLLKKIERMMKEDIEEHFSCSPEYALDRYTIALLHFRKHHPSAALLPFIGDATFEQTLETLPERLVENLRKQIAWSYKTDRTEGIALSFYNRCQSWIEEINPAACNLLPEFREMVARAYFGNYGRDGKPRFSET